MTFQVRERTVAHRKRPSPSMATTAAQQALVQRTRARILDAGYQCVIAGVWPSYGNVAVFDPLICRATYDNHRSILDDLEDEYVSTGKKPSNQYAARLKWRRPPEAPMAAADRDAGRQHCRWAAPAGGADAGDGLANRCTAAETRIEQLEAAERTHEARERRSADEIARLERLRRDDAVKLADAKEELRRLRAFVDASLALA